MKSLYEIQPKNIEIGAILIDDEYAIIHVVHMVYQSEIDIFGQELNNDDNLTQKINPQFYTRQLFDSLSEEINGLIHDHFSLSNNFVVSYHDFQGIKRRIWKITDKKRVRKEDGKMDKSMEKILSKYFEKKINVEGFNIKKEKLYEIINEIDTKRIRNEKERFKYDEEDDDDESDISQDDDEQKEELQKEKDDESLDEILEESLDVEDSNSK